MLNGKEGAFNFFTWGEGEGETPGGLPAVCLGGLPSRLEWSSGVGQALWICGAVLFRMAVAAAISVACSTVHLFMLNGKEGTFNFFTWGEGEGETPGGLLVVCLDGLPSRLEWLSGAG